MMSAARSVRALAGSGSGWGLNGMWLAAVERDEFDPAVSKEWARWLHQVFAEPDRWTPDPASRLHRREGAQTSDADAFAPLRFRSADAAAGRGGPVRRSGSGLSLGRDGRFRGGDRG